jgi:hypothetical protein
MRVKIVALAHLGHLDEACAELSRVLAIDPKLTIAAFGAYGRSSAPEVSTSPACAWLVFRRGEPPLLPDPEDLSPVEPNVRSRSCERDRAGGVRGSELRDTSR